VKASPGLCPNPVHPCVSLVPGVQLPRPIAPLLLPATNAAMFLAGGPKRAMILAGPPRQPRVQPAEAGRGTNKET